MTEYDPKTVKTMADVHRIMEDLGQPTEGVGYADDWYTRKDSGSSLLSRGSDGRWVITSHDRGGVFNPRTFDSEELALQELAAIVIRAGRKTKSRPLTDEEIAAVDVRRARILERARRARDDR